METEVAIIGAGLSGLLACKYVLSKGYRPVVFESQNSVGGVWTKTLKNTCLQTPKHFYQFSDFPWPPHPISHSHENEDDNFPSQPTVLHYLLSYARHFDLLPFIRFNSTVLSLAPDPHLRSWNSNSPGKWSLVVKDTFSSDSSGSGSISTCVWSAGFVILCVGRFSGVRNIPEFSKGEGMGVFRGKVMHSMDFSAMDDEAAVEVVRGKRVVVVGIQKSALDISAFCSSVNGVRFPCTLLYRSLHWTFPNFHPWGVPLGYLYFNRFSEMLIRKPGAGFLLNITASLLSPLRWLISMFVESSLRWKLPLAKYGKVPNHHFSSDIDTCVIATAPSGFYDRVGDGSIVLKKSPRFGFVKNGVVIHGKSHDTTLDADVVILATGFRGHEKLADLFSSTPAFKSYISAGSTVALYRECIHPRIPQLAVIGYSESISNIFTSEMRCRWVAELLAGTFEVPGVEKMEEDILRWNKYMEESGGRSYGRRRSISTINIWYNDHLCRDMGWNPKRKKGFLDELFTPYGPCDYLP